MYNRPRFISQNGRTAIGWSFSPAERNDQPPAGAAFAPALFVLCRLPVRCPPREAGWCSGNGALRLELRSGSDCALPYGQDRALLILLATIAWRQRSRQVDLGSAYEILQTLGQSATGTDYRRLRERFLRLLNCRFRAWSVATDESVTADREFPLHEQAELWYQRPADAAQTKRFRNVITLSEGFCAEVRQSPVQVTMPLVRALVNAPVALDLALLIACRSHQIRPGRHVRIPVTGTGGLSDQLSEEPYLQERDFRRQVRTWLAAIKAAWPDCPAVLTQDSKILMICRCPLVTGTPW